MEELKAAAGTSRWVGEVAGYAQVREEAELRVGSASASLLGLSASECNERIA
jgi:hypothetical protein